MKILFSLRDCYNEKNTKLSNLYEHIGIWLINEIKKEVYKI